MSLLTRAKQVETQKQHDFKVVPQELFDLVEAYLKGDITRSQATQALYGNQKHSGFDSVFKRTIETGVRVGRYTLKIDSNVTAPKLKLKR